MPEIKSKATAASSLTLEKISLNISHFLVFDTKPEFQGEYLLVQVGYSG